jgi:excisionase family DNA binding protein
MEFLSTQQVAEKLGIDVSGVRRLILSGKLPATKVGRDHLIREEDLALVAERKPGRPKKAAGEAKPIIHADTPVEVAPVQVEPVTVSPAEIVPVSIEPEIIKPPKKKKK